MNPAPRAQNNLLGLMLAILGSGAWAAMAAIGKLIGMKLPPFMAAFLYNLISFLILVPWIIYAGPRQLRTAALGKQIMRALAFSAGVLSWFWALPLVQLADMTALSFTSSLFVPLGAVFILGEPSKTWRWVALAFGFGGMLIILRPGFGEVSIGMLLLIFSSLAMATMRLISKIIMRRDTPMVLIVWQAGLIALFTLPAALAQWQWPTLEQFLLLAAMALSGTLQQIFAAWSIRLADFGVIEPVNFLRLVWGVALGLAIFGDIPSITTLTGGCVLIVTVLYITRRERCEGGGGI